LAASAEIVGGITVSRPETNPWIIAVAVMLATFMEVLDTSIAAVALPYIAGSVSATNDEATWVLTSYLVANAIILPASSWFSIKFGRKRFLITCIMIFTASSFFCGAASSLGLILLARALQGAGGGALQPLSQAILLESFPPEKRGLAMSVFALGVVVAPVLGPTLGGWLTENYSWRWAFYINIPVGIIAILLIARFVEDPPYIKNAKAGKLDVWGLGMLAVWLGALQIILDKGQEDDWFGATWIRWAAVILVVALAAFLIRELTHDKPLVDLRIFKNRNFLMGCVLIFLFGGVVYGLITLLPLFFQELLGYTALAAGLAVAPRGLGSLFFMPVIGILTGRVDNRYLVCSGFIGMGICTLWMGQSNLEIGPWSLFWPIILSGACLSLIFVPLATSTMGTLRNEEIGNASGLYNLMRNVGGSIGISVVNTLLARHRQVHRDEMSHNIAAYSHIFQDQLKALTTYLSQHADPATAARQAEGILNRILEGQSALWAFVDDFRYLAALCFFCAPVAFTMVKVKKGKGGTLAH
jgi:MFS transporter, DHA2 family, multidrug resistance protein